jgi:hypothetical protein
MSKEPASQSEIVLYQTEDGRTRLEVRFEGETAWLTQAQMAELFQTTKQNVSLHIQNIFAEGELHGDSVVKESLTTAAEGMYMRDWIAKLEDFLRISGREILTHAGRISHEQAAQKAELEFERHRELQINQPSAAEQDFEKAVKQIESEAAKPKKGQA